MLSEVIKTEFQTSSLWTNKWILTKFQNQTFLLCLFVSLKFLLVDNMAQYLDRHRPNQHKVLLPFYVPEHYDETLEFYLASFQRSFFDLKLIIELSDSRSVNLIPNEIDRYPWTTGRGSLVKNNLIFSRLSNFWKIDSMNFEILYEGLLWGYKSFQWTTVWTRIILNNSESIKMI